MRIMKKLLLLAVALGLGSGLGYLLLSDFEPVNIAIFSIACVAFGKILHGIDKKIS